MLLKSVQTFALLSVFATTTCLAQSESEKMARPEMGSAVLHQSGDEKSTSKNSVYDFEQIIDIPGSSQAVLYDHVKKWIIDNLKTSQESIFFDDINKASITANTAIRLKDSHPLTSQVVEFKLSVSFKDGKSRVQATDFVYRSIALGSVFQKPFNDLRPFAKNLRRTIYKEFDEKFDSMQKSLNAAIKGDGADNW